MRKLIADDKNLVVYRPALREIGGSIAGTVLLQQIIYWDEKSGGKFYKFAEPCKNERYKEGDSWEEELGMSAKELRTALSHFAFKCGKKNKDKYGDGYKQAREGALVQYYTDSNRVTWYLLNRQLLSKLLMGIYKESDQREVTLNTETTSETTTDISKVAIAPEREEIKPIRDGAEHPADLVSARAKEHSGANDPILESFERIWSLYDKKTGKPAALRYWKRLSKADREAIEKAIPAYVAATPDKKFRKNLQGWINPANRMWEDEVVVDKPKNQGYTNVDTSLF